jgi:hypothetical protein
MYGRHPGIATGLHPTMRGFISFANESRRLLPLIVKYLSGNERVRFGFFWQDPDLRASSDLTVDTDRVDLDEVLMLITDRAHPMQGCEPLLRARR